MLVHPRLPQLLQSLQGEGYFRKRSLEAARREVAAMRRDFKECKTRPQRARYLLGLMWDRVSCSARHLSNTYLRGVFGISSAWARDLRVAVDLLEDDGELTLDAQCVVVAASRGPRPGHPRPPRELSPEAAERRRIITTVLELYTRADPEAHGKNGDVWRVCIDPETNGAKALWDRVQEHAESEGVELCTSFSTYNRELKRWLEEEGHPAYAGDGVLTAEGRAVLRKFSKDHNCEAAPARPAAT